MNKVALSLVLAFTPATLLAQSARAEAHAKSNADVKAGPAQASSATTVDAEISAARERNLPTQPVRRRAAEARAKGRTDAQAALAARRMRAHLETSHDVLIQAGRDRPRDEEIERGAYVLERGYTRAQLEAVAKSAPSDRSLVVAFDVLTRLAARGVASTNAVSQVQSRLEARATDAQLTALASSNAALGVGNVPGGAAASGNAAAGAGVTATKGATSATGSVTGAVGGVLKKP
jgi:hypothetical protein